jgi:hypothetical protein
MCYDVVGEDVVYEALAQALDVIRVERRDRIGCPELSLLPPTATVELS